MSSTWQQVLAAMLAAVIPVIVKLLNDWQDRLEGKANPTTPTPAPSSSSPAAPDQPA